MRERGRYQIQLMKTRSSSGVGQKIDLGFDVDTLRIVDIGEDEEQATASAGGSSASSIVNALKRTNTPGSSGTVSDDPAEGENVKTIKAKTDSTKLRDFINNLGDE
jgi:hypothetical protein